MQANLYTPLALVKALLPKMLEQGRGTIINMVSFTAFNNPPARGDQGGWSFAYPASKAALARMAGSLRVEHPDAGLRCYNLEPGMVFTQVMRAAGMTEELMARYKPISGAAIAGVVAWLAENDAPEAWWSEDALRGPAIAKYLRLLNATSLLEKPNE
jgi:NAD(P)-dependent dehydrogenase (short-subunit alcohol dehydrogenase family)